MRKLEPNQEMFHIDRRGRIAEIVEEKGNVSVRELVDVFGVSEVTIRTDLKVLEQNGVLTRTYGGAIKRRHSSLDSKYEERQATRLNLKAAIAREAIKYLQPNDSLVLDGGTTITEFVKLLANNNYYLNIVTNFIPHIPLLEEHPNAQVSVLGGIYSETSKNLYGPMALSTMKNIFVDKAFIGTNGITVEDGLSCTSFEEAEMRKMYVQNSKMKILLVDSSKFGVRGFASSGRIEDLDVIITDWEIDPATVKAIEQKGVKVIVASQQ